MALIRIGEALHCHIPSVQDSARRWLCGDALDREAGHRHLVKLVRDQVAGNAHYLDVNVDNFLSESGVERRGALQILDYILGLILEHGQGIPPCVDSSDPETLSWGLRRWQERTGGRGRPPLINSVAISRLEPLALRREFPFSFVGMLLERAGDTSAGFTDIAGPEAYHETARAIFARAREQGFALQEIFFDPTVGPLGADMVGYTRRTFEGIRAIRSDPEMAGVHICLGLSNCSDGLPRRRGMNKAYLKVAMDYGADAAILDVVSIDEQEGVDPHLLRLVRRVVEKEGIDALPLLVDFAQAYPRGQEWPVRAPFPDLFRAALSDPGQTAYLLEIAPGDRNVEQIYAMAEGLRNSPFTFTITDTPSGKHLPGPDTIGLEVARIMNRQAIVNLSCKSDDRTGIMRRVLALYQQGLRHCFAVTGDYPFDGRPCFDLDAVTLLLGLEALRRGRDAATLLPLVQGPLEGLMAGSAVSPFKYAEPDLWGQYLKMWKKWRAGAAYFITQVGFDPKKFCELRLYANRAGMGGVPLLGSVYYLDPRVVYVLTRHRVPGLTLPEDLCRKYYSILLPKDERARIRKLSFVELVEYEKGVAIRRAALLADILVRGLEYKGVDLAGIPDVETALAILELIQELKGRDWRESLEEYRAGDGTRPMELGPPGGFYLFPDGGDGLLRHGPFQQADRRGYAASSRAMGWLHRTFFEKGKGLYGLLEWAASGPPDSAALGLLTQAEQAIKSAALGCEMCGDCRIAELFYHCPEPSQGCAKHLLNGPCGGADERGMCEVHPERRCYWNKVIEAALAEGKFDQLYQIQLPKNPRLQHTSSWRNEVLGLRAEAMDLGKPTH
jgi:methylenetetrahydrofolate reductase (NADPH)